MQASNQCITRKEKKNVCSLECDAALDTFQMDCCFVNVSRERKIFGAVKLI